MANGFISRPHVLHPAWGGEEGHGQAFKALSGTSTLHILVHLNYKHNQIAGSPNEEKQSFLVYV